MTGIKGSEPVDENLAAARIMSQVQDLLEVRQLSRMRRAVVQGSYRRTGGDSLNLKKFLCI